MLVSMNNLKINVKKILFLIGIKIYLLLLRIYGRLILKCSNQIFQLLRIKIQLHFLSHHKEMTIDKIYKISHLTCLKYLHDKIPDEYVLFYQKEAEPFKEASELIEQREDLRVLIADYFRVLSFYFISGFETEFLKAESEKYYKKASKILGSITRLDRKEFTELSKRIQKEYRETKKELNKQIKEFISEKTYEILPKIKITPSDIYFILSISSTLFFFNRIYL